MTRSRTGGLPIRPSRPSEAWCEDASHRNYNHLIPEPLPGSTEQLWRADCAYDVLAVIDYNLRPRVRGKGSAIFFHLIRPGAHYTAGCIAISARDMRKLLPILGRRTRLVIGG